VGQLTHSPTEAEFVAKVGRYYVLIDTGKKLLELLSEEAKAIRDLVKEFTKIFSGLGYKVVHQFLEGKFPDLSTVLDIVLAYLVAQFIVSLHEVVTVVGRRELEEALDKLWRDEELREGVKLALTLVRASGREGVRAIERIIHYNLLIVLYNLAVEVGLQEQISTELQLLSKLLEKMREARQRTAGRS
jgi:hypothetical protein